MRSLLVVTLVTGCGFSVSGSPPGDAGRVDAVVDVQAPIDAPIDAPEPRPCLAKWMDGTMQLEAPIQLTALGSGTASDRDPFISADGLTLYYASDRIGSVGGSDVYKSTRASTAATFDTAVRADDLSSSAYDTRVSLTADGLLAVRSADNNGTPDLAQAIKESSGVFGAFSASLFTNVNDATPQYDPEISSDGLRLYWAQGAPQRIVMVSRASRTDVFANPVDIITGTSNNADPALSADERILVFASSRSGSGDVYYATRASVSDPFGTPVKLPTVNENGSSEGDPALSADGCTLYFASNRGAGSDYELYAARVML